MKAASGVRRLHRALGLALVLPILLWAATGLLFHLKPGWGAAYAPLALPAEPLAGALALPEDGGWLEVRGLRTALGAHWLVRTTAGWQHLDGALRPWPEPGEEELRRLVEPALASDRARYGTIVGREEGGAFVTSTGARVELDWSTLRLSQRGTDTDRIDALYRVHYLQWTGVPALDRPLALLGLAALVLLALLGLRLVRR